MYKSETKNGEKIVKMQPTKYFAVRLIAISYISGWPPTKLRKAAPMRNDHQSSHTDGQAVFLGSSISESGTILILGSSQYVVARSQMEKCGVCNLQSYSLSGASKKRSRRSAGYLKNEQEMS